MTDIQKTISPVDDSVYVERTRATAQQIDATLSKAAAAQADWNV